MKQKKLMDRGILLNTSPSPSGAPDVSPSPTGWNFISPSNSYSNLRIALSNGSSPAGSIVYRPVTDRPSVNELRSSLSQASFEDLQSAHRADLFAEEFYDSDDEERDRCVAPGPLEMLVGGFDDVMPKRTTPAPSAFSAPVFSEQPRANSHAMRLQLSKSPVQFNTILPPDQSKNVILSTAFSAFSPAVHRDDLVNEE